MKKIIILGSTGSIGTQTLDIVDENPDLFTVTALSCRSRVDELIQQIEKYRPLGVCVGNEAHARRVQERFPNLTVYYGDEGLVQLTEVEGDMIVNSLMGISGLAPTYHGIRLGKDIALANKETWWRRRSGDGCRGEKGVKLLPVDSEHSAIFQCLEGNKGREIQPILLTASADHSGSTLRKAEDVTLDQALNRHPEEVDHGSEDCIDSATMMNKGASHRGSLALRCAGVQNRCARASGVSFIPWWNLRILRLSLRWDFRICGFRSSLALGYPERLEYSGQLGLLHGRRQSSFREASDGCVPLPELGVSGH